LAVVVPFENPSPPSIARLIGFLTADRIADKLGVSRDSPARMQAGMLQVLRDSIGDEPGISIVEHDLDRPLPVLGLFDAVVSSFAIHHVSHERKRSLYREIFGLLTPGGVFLNLEHVTSPTASLHARFLDTLGVTPETEDPSNKLLDFQTQLAWLREIGFEDVDCCWKWLELALLSGVKGR